MAFVVADRVAETSTTTGTGTYTLAGAKAGYRSFAAIGNANVTFYVATDGTDWEVGVGTYTASGTTLARTAILASSNANAAVDWGAGTKDIAATNPAARSFWNLGAGLVKGDGAGTVSAVPISSFAEGLLDDTSAGAMRATLDLEPGTDVMGYDAELAAIAGLTSAANKGILFTGLGTASLIDITTTAQGLLDDTSAGAMRATLGFTTSDLSAFTDPQTTDYLLAFDGTTLKIISFGSWFNIIGVLTQFTGAIDGAADRLFFFESGVGMQQISPDTLISGKQTIFVPAGAMVSTTTNGAADGTTELATNDVMLKSKDFDTSTLEKVQFSVAMPKSYNGGTVTFRAYWTAASGSGGVAISVAARAFSNDDALDQAFGTAVTVTDTLIAANDLHDTGESSAITIAGTPADHDLVIFEVSRAVSNGSDTLGVDMKLLGLAVYFTTDVRDDT